VAVGHLPRGERTLMLKRAGLVGFRACQISLILEENSRVKEILTRSYIFDKIKLQKELKQCLRLKP
jgi:hypothetical protein